MVEVNRLISFGNIYKLIYVSILKLLPIKGITMPVEKIKEIKNVHIKKFFKMESAGGILLMIAAVLALICANTPLSVYYDMLLSTTVEVRMGDLGIEKPLLLWINDGLMAIFFFLIGLELKRELINGELSDKRNIILPGMGAIGGMLFPALVYVYFNIGDEDAIRGWAIPAATDIAFALGVLSLLGSRVPISLKIFLTSLAIFDDIGAIIIIAAFYTSDISMISLGIAIACIPVLFLLNRYNTESKSMYIFVGFIMWFAMLKSGVHATLAGVLLAMFIPMQSKQNPEYSPLETMEHDLHSVVAFFILPIFAFANSGITLIGLSSEQVLHPVPVGIALGLFIGKQVGIFGLCFLAIKTGLTKMPNGMDFGSLYGASALCGIGFTMSLFIGSLAFEGMDVGTQFDERLGIIMGSLLSGMIGYLILRKTLKNN